MANNYSSYDGAPSMLFDFFRKFKFFQNHFDLYTDGSHKAKWGTWAFVVVQNGKVIHESSGRERKTNSQRMEFQAAIEGLKYFSTSAKIDVHTDSKILLNAVVDRSKRPVMNSDQLEKLDQLNFRHQISWSWVRAHSGNLHNERCDQLCVLARDRRS